MLYGSKQNKDISNINLQILRIILELNSLDLVCKERSKRPYRTGTKWTNTDQMGDR